MLILGGSAQRLLKAPGLVPLWIAGGAANAMLWLEVLAAALFTLQVTRSGFDVALVSAARSLPLLVTGAFMGVISDATNRKRIVVGGLVVSAASAGTVGMLAAIGVLRPWQIGIAALISGLVYATEMPARRRMVAESAGPALALRAVAVDSMMSYATRCAGPLLGGLAYQYFGLAGAFLLSACLNIGMAILVARIHYRQDLLRRLSLLGALQDLRDGLAFAVRRHTLVLLLGVTILTNLFGYSYSTLLTPIGKLVLDLSPFMIGVLAAAEPAGSLLAGIFVAVRPLPGHPLRWLAGGATLLFSVLIAAAIVGRMPHALVPMLVLFALGGVGSAVYNIHQTTIVMTETPPAFRSRVMGLVTVCIGSWPIGMIAAGALIDPLGLMGALAALGIGGLAGMAVLAGYARSQRHR
ncbi:MFS transporter [Acidisoma cellulosilytica]|uniref:MFS transporter n=1 Tax=Acidisoma cellulosilyticum TaxID=2802395 RepID=A0A963Z3J6_9PROT|nr:MFS transporter [Acidisoma cellulosilyticum]MCB8882175.1 MFS transporter [Acidisoma cellulosilyticum]